MRLLVHKLAGVGAEVGEERIERSDLEVLGRALYLDEHALAGAHHLLGNQLEANLGWLRAVVHLVGGAEALESFDQGIVGLSVIPMSYALCWRPCSDLQTWRPRRS